MAKIRSRNTQPEIAVRYLLHAMGYRYRLHRKDLPGKPDIVFSRRRKAVFVHGCFWHQHERFGCLDSRKPKSNTGYWNSKLERNVERDARHLEALKAGGWDVVTIWECEIGDTSLMVSSLQRFLGAPRHSIATENLQIQPIRESRAVEPAEDSLALQ